MQYCWGCSVLWMIPTVLWMILTVLRMILTLLWMIPTFYWRIFSNVGDTISNMEGYQQHCGGYSVLWKKTTSTLGITYRACGSSLKYWTSTTMMMVSLHKSDVIPLQCWFYPSSVLMLSLHSTKVLHRGSLGSWWCRSHISNCWINTHYKITLNLSSTRRQTVSKSMNTIFP